MDKLSRNPPTPHQYSIMPIKLPMSTSTCISFRALRIPGAGVAPIEALSRDKIDSSAQLARDGPWEPLLT
jgi:hypothetical protein